MKLVVSDLDGTLLNGQSMVTEHTKNTVKKLIDKGIKFAIATGRGEASAMRFRDDMGLSIYLICNNGANIYDDNENMIFERVIEKEIAHKIIEVLRKRRVTYNCFYHEDFYKDEYDTEDYSRRIGFREHTLRDITECPPLHKIIIEEEPDVILSVNEELREKFSNEVEITISDPRCIDIVPKGCSKGNALALIAQEMNISMEKIMAFGDGENDLDMLKKVGHPVVMENAQEIVKKVVRNRAPKNIDNGVAKYLEKYFKI